MNKLGKFEILGKLGQGAMGVVYKARDPLIGRIVALKTITTGLADSPELLKRFYGEAQSAGRLQHPNIVTIFELGNERDTPFIAMEFLTGESLDKLIARRPGMSLSQKLGYIVYVCRALEYAHRQNPSVIHRDIKPGNVMVTSDGIVKVVDFGIARLGEGSHSQSSGMLIGTLGYMSPQQFRGGSAEARSDIWAAGIMLYELLCYHRPFEAENPGALMTSIVLDPHRPISEASPGTPAEIEAIVDRMLSKELDARYQSMEEVLSELEPIWNKVKEAEVSDLVANGRQFFEARDLAKAGDIVRKALQLDTSNTQAKSLLEKIKAELYRSKVIHQVREKVESGQNLLAAGQIEDAKAAAEAALRLDSTFQPARELLEQVQVAAERVRFLANALRASKQRLAEGALTEAELQLDKVLELDPKNSAAQDLLKQIRDEKARRERQKRLAETLHRARTLWTNLQYEECIGVLLEAEKEFPGEREISRLLHTAREDQSEQRRQSLLSEARKLLSGQKFEETIQALDRLLESFPSDVTAKNLRTLALQGQEHAKREQRLNENLTRLRALVEKGKYQEVAEAGQKLLEEFPDEFELVELIHFARSEQSHIEQKRRLDEWIKRIQRSVKDERFSAAVQDAEEALKEFRQDVELLILHERAKKGQEDKEREELLRQRLKEVEKRIERQELTGAIDLARQTLVTVGPHAGLANLLHRAEMEFEQRNKKRREQDGTFDRARTLLDAGELSDATLILQNAVETKLFTKSDPRVAPLFDEIEAKKKQLRGEEAFRELRNLLASGKHSDVIKKGEALLQELPQEAELRELVDFAKEEISREQQKQEAKEHEKKIQSLLEAGSYLEAEEAASRAAKAYPKLASFRRLLEEARGKKREQDERERLRQEIERRKGEQRRKEEQERQVDAVRTVIEQGNLLGATQLLNQAIAGKILEPSSTQARELESEIARKKRKAEEHQKEEQRRKKEQARQIEAVRTVIEQGNLAEATQLLNQAIAGKVLEPSSAQARELESEIEQKKRKAEERRKEEQRRREEQEQRIEAVRTVIEQGNPGDATQLLDQAIAAKVLERSDVRTKQLRNTIREEERKLEIQRKEEQKRKKEQQKQEEERRKAEAREQSEARELQLREKEVDEAAITPRRGRPIMFAMTAAVVVAGIVYAELKFSARPHSREFVLKQESQDLRKQGRLDEAISKDQEIVNLRGTLVSWAKVDLESITELRRKQHEDKFMTDGRTAEESKNDPLAAEKYQNAADLHGPRETEARTAREVVEKRINAKPAEGITQEFFDQGRGAFERREYPTAKRFFQESLSRAPEAWSQRKQVQEYLTKTEHVLAQQELLQKAQNSFAAKEYKSAEQQATKALNMRDGDSQFGKQADEIARRSKHREEQENIYDQAAKLEQQGRRTQASETYQRVAQFEDGDEGIVARAKEGIARTAAVQPSPTDYAKVVSEIEGLISNKQFESAKAKLASSLPANQPAYQKLLDTIQDGENKQEEERFAENVRGFRQAEAAKNTDQLNKIRPYFVAEANAAGRHHDEADTIVTQIDALLRPPKPPPPESPCSSADKSQDCDAIRDLVEAKLSNAYGQRNLRELESLWPALSGMKDSRQNLKAMFDGASKFSRQFVIKEWKFMDPNQVRVSGSYSGEYVGREGSHMPSNGDFDIRVIRDNGRWVIKDIIQ